MAAVFQANIFQHNVFQVGSLTPNTVGGSIVRYAPHTYSRKDYDKYLAAKRAQAEAERKAAELKDSKRKRILEEAAAVAEEAIEAAEAAREDANLVSLTNLLEAASSAGRVKDAIKQSRAVIAEANAMLAQMKEMEDEEEAIMLLLN